MSWKCDIIVKINSTCCWRMEKLFALVLWIMFCGLNFVNAEYALTRKYITSYDNIRFQLMPLSMWIPRATKEILKRVSQPRLTTQKGKFEMTVLQKCFLTWLWHKWLYTSLLLMARIRKGFWKWNYSWNKEAPYVEIRRWFWWWKYRWYNDAPEGID